MAAKLREVTSLPQLIRRNPFPPVEFPARMTWTSSSLRLFRKCKRKWFWKYVLRLRPKFKDKNLVIGSEFHAVLGDWYLGNTDDIAVAAGERASAMQSYAEEHAAFYDQEDLDKFTMQIDNFTGMMTGYAAAYGDDFKKWRIEPESVEAQFLVKYADYDFAGKCDLVAVKTENRRRTTFAVEHKTASRLRESYIERLPLDTQIRGYITGVTKGMGYPINEILYDVVVKCKLRRKANETLEERRQRVEDEYLSQPDKYFYREALMFSEADVKTFEWELEQTHQEYLDLVARAQDVGQPGLLNPRSWAPNDGTCDEYFRLCEYFKLCTVGLDAGTGKMFEQGEDLNEELADVED